MGLSWPEMSKAYKATGHRCPLQTCFPLKIYHYSVPTDSALGPLCPARSRPQWETHRCHLVQGEPAALQRGGREERRENKSFLEQEWYLCCPWRSGWTLQERHMGVGGGGGHSRLEGDHRATLCAAQQAVSGSLCRMGYKALSIKSGRQCSRIKASAPMLTPHSP